MSDRDGMLDETTLRRALRFESDERVPRFDVAAIAAVAGAGPSRAAVVFGVTACAVTALAAASTWSVIAAFAPDIVNAVVSFTLDTVVTVATMLEPLAEIASQPVVPFSLIAALGVAIIHTLYERREHVHVNAS